MVEPENHSDNKGSRFVRAPDSELGSGLMGSGVGSGVGSGMGSTSPPTNVIELSNELEIWHIGVISFGALSLAFCCVFMLMVSPSISYI